MENVTTKEKKHEKKKQSLAFLLSAGVIAKSISLPISLAMQIHQIMQDARKSLIGEG